MVSSRREPRGYQRTRWGALAAAGIIAITFVSSQDVGSAAPAAAGIEPGQGLAIAQTDRVDPRSGGLSIGITFGISIAAHQNQVAQASSQAMDLGVIGTTLAAEGCSNGPDDPPGDPTLPADKQPQPVQVDSRSPDAERTKDEDESAAPVPIHKHAEATEAPFGKSVTTTSPIGLPGVLEVGSGVATSYSGVLEDGKTREAKAVTDISGITFPGGIGLSGLHWEATWRSTDGAQPVGVFTIASATGPLGAPIPTDDPVKAIGQMNDALKVFGLQIDPPTAREAGGVLFVDPMGISVIPSAQRDQVAGALFGGIQPVRQNLFDALLAADCSNATPITITDIVVGSITGAGAFHLSLGGVQASSGEVAANPFALGVGGVQLGTGGVNLPAVGTTVGSGGGTTFKPGSTGSSTPSGTAAPAAPAAGTGTAAPAKAVAAAKPKGERGGALAGVGLASLGMLAALAEGDRRKMRRAQREIPQFEE
jgi:hypothetical protein